MEILSKKMFIMIKTFSYKLQNRNPKVLIQKYQSHKFQIPEIKQIGHMYQTNHFPQRINVASNSPAVYNKVAAMRRQTTQQTLQLINSQVLKMRQSNQQINSILNQIQMNKVKCAETMNNLTREIGELDSRVNDYQRGINSTAEEDKIRAQIKGFHDQYINVCRERVAIAEQINVKHLYKIKIDDKKSPANQVFRWILSTMYNEPDNKYFWPNFRDEAFKNRDDKGRDFIQRLGKISAMEAKQQHRFRTQQFLQNYNMIASSPQFQKARPEIDKIHQIAKCFKRSYMISDFIKQRQAGILKHKQSTLEKDEQFMRWKARSQALKQRVQTNQQFLQVLNQTSARLLPKRQLYAQKLQSGQALLRDFQGFQNMPVMSKPTPVYTPTINTTHLTMPDRTGHCQQNCEACQIF